MRGLEPDHLASYRSKQYIINSTAVQQYMWYCRKTVHYIITAAAAAVRT